MYIHQPCLHHCQHGCTILRMGAKRPPWPDDMMQIVITFVSDQMAEAIVPTSYSRAVMSYQIKQDLQLSTLECLQAPSTNLQQAVTDPGELKLDLAPAVQPTADIPQPVAEAEATTDVALSEASQRKSQSELEIHLRCEPCTSCRCSCLLHWHRPNSNTFCLDCNQ